MTQERIDVIFTSTGARKVRRNIDDIGKTSKTSHSSVNLLRRGIQLLAGAYILRQLARLTDQFTNLQNRLRVVTDSMDELNFVQRELLSISNRTRSSLATNAELYTRLTLATKELNVPLRERLAVTQSINQAVILSGASSQEASAGLIQLSQGLASGALRGDELRSVLEQLPVIADIIAKELGVTRGELRGLGEDGKITSEIIIRSFRNARDELNEQFAKTVPTLGQAWTVLGSNVLFAVGRLNEAQGTTRGLAGLIGDIGIKIGDSADEFVAFGNVAVKTIGRLISKYDELFKKVIDNVSIQQAFYIVFVTAALTIEDTLGLFRGFRYATVAIFTSLGPALRKIFADIFNGLVEIVENSFNAISSGINKISSFVKLPEIPRIDLTDFKKDVRYQFSDIGGFISDAFNLGVNDPTRITLKSLVEDYRKELAAIQSGFNGSAPGGGTSGQIGTGGNALTFFERLKQVIPEVKNQLDDANGLIEDTFINLFEGAENALINFVQTGKLEIKDFVNSVLEDILRLQIRNTITNPLLNLFSGGLDAGAGAGIFGGIGKLLGFANGGSFEVGGSGGSDTQLVQFMATPREVVTVSPPGQQPGKVEVNVINNTNAQATVQESQTAGGGRSIDIMIDEVVAQKVGNHGSKVNRAIRQTFGVNQRIQGR